MIYLIGSLKNPEIPIYAKKLRDDLHIDIFDDWYSPGKNADDEWQAYEKARGRTYQQALDGAHAWDVFNFDRMHLDLCDAVVLALPAGKSAHMELGYVIGQGRPGFIFLPHGEPERYDVMYRFATEVVTTYIGLLQAIKHHLKMEQTDVDLITKKTFSTVERAMTAYIKRNMNE